MPNRNNNLQKRTGQIICYSLCITITGVCVFDSVPMNFWKWLVFVDLKRQKLRQSERKTIFRTYKLNRHTGNKTEPFLWSTVFRCVIQCECRYRWISRWVRDVKLCSGNGWLHALYSKMISWGLFNLFSSNSQNLILLPLFTPRVHSQPWSCLCICLHKTLTRHVEIWLVSAPCVCIIWGIHFYFHFRIQSHIKIIRFRCNK